ncbi:FtsX-like permease family protein [Segetibacter sp. 3557_3]|uniref:ABC transporter permease n=1 Tax=Segetibacter sp. 3557_3 TaxID=2547429 RepID=UPI001059203A|nr:ABC transporter permease [Segetibacter sp. 3557_3]TDH28783.1 FtsX-like permease family protein [Segetibacter sp. 3557_3]
MLKNYFKTALRNLLRYKGFTAINILSLSIGITGCMLIGLFVWDEWKYDKFIQGGENVYRLYTERKSTEGNTSTASVAPMFATHLKQQFPEVDNTLRILMAGGKLLLEHENVKAYEEKYMFTEASFFSIFPLKFLQGDPKTALAEPSSVVITSDLASKYFGNQSALGKTIKVEQENFVVKGVLAGVPEHFHLDFNLLLSLKSAGLPESRMESWGWQQFFTYVKVKPGTNVGQLQSKFQAEVKRLAHPKTSPGGFTYQAYFQPLKNIHLQSSEFSYDNAKRGNETYVNGLSSIALFVLIIACFNFINLATARSFRRAKEIGVRKVIGADRRQLLLQFTGETILLSLVSVLVATIASMIILPALNTFTEKQIAFNPFTDPILAAGLIAAGMLIGILAGIYPAIVLSGFQPIKVLKGIKSSSASPGHVQWLRQALVIIQFSLSALLIISTTIVYRQVRFLHETDMGFNKDEILYFPVRGEVAKNPEAFKDELKRSANVVAATAGYGLPGDQYAGDGVIIPGKEGDKRHSANLFIVDHDYISTLGIKMVAGRDFSKDMATDVDEAFIISETAVRELGFGTPQKALGQPIHWDKWEKDSLNPLKKGRVIGVIKDFHYKSLHEKVTTTVLQIYPPALAKMAVKVKTADLPNTIAYIKQVWSRFSPDYPLDYKFMDESFAAMYKSEDKLGSLLWIFTIMAVVVGCMGLFGLAAFSAEQRNKEISIRKVLGASIGGIVALLSRSFLKPVFIASVIAFPIAWFAMNKWLENFPYRVTISWWVFGIAAVAALLIALITVSFQTIKAALSNPVTSLRNE